MHELAILRHRDAVHRPDVVVLKVTALAIAPQAEIRRLTLAATEVRVHDAAVDREPSGVVRFRDDVDLGTEQSRLTTREDQVINVADVPVLIGSELNDGPRVLIQEQRSTLTNVL